MDMARRVSLHNVKLPSNLLKEVDTERMGKLNEDEGEFLEFLDSLDLEDVSIRVQILCLLTVYTKDCQS